MTTPEMSFVQLLIGLVLIIIPAYALYKYKTGLVRDLFVSVIRMVIQLFLVGFYLNYIFEWNNMWINISWLLLMVGVCATDMLRRIEMPWKVLFPPIYFAVFTSVTFILVYFIKGVLQLENLFDSRMFIPIAGILMGNILSSNVIGLNAFYSSIIREQQMYHYLLGNGATQQEAISPFVKRAIIKAFNPAIASMAAMGLIALPGTMVGQIIGGSSPDLSIRYQIMIMVINLSASMLSVLISLQLSMRYTFDKYGRLKKSITNV